MAQTQQQGDRFKDYVTVAERVALFYQTYPAGRINTQIIQHDLETGFVLMRAEVFRSPDDAQPSATGHGFEVRGESYVNKTSYVENCETGCVGRALALLGFEVKRGIASREEMQKAERMQQQGPRPVTRPEDVPGVSKGMPTKAPATDEDKLDQKISNALHILGMKPQELTAMAQAKFRTKVPWYDHTVEQKEQMYAGLNNKANEAAK